MFVSKTLTTDICQTGRPGILLALATVRFGQPFGRISREWPEIGVRHHGQSHNLESHNGCNATRFWVRLSQVYSMT